MQITSLNQLDSGDFPIAYYYDLTPATMAMLTEYNQSQLEGFFGAPSSSVGILEIHYEEYMSWSDIAECMEGSHEAIIPIQYREEFNVPPKVDETDKAIGKILNAMHELKSNHWLRDWDFQSEDDLYFRILNRYAGLLGYRCIATSITGTDRGDDLNILHIIPVDRDEKQTTLHYEVAPYWEGNRYDIVVRLTSPYKDEEPHHESMGYIVGRDEYILDTAKEMVTDAIADITTRKKKG